MTKIKVKEFKELKPNLIRQKGDVMYCWIYLSEDKVYVKSLSTCYFDNLAALPSIQEDILEIKKLREGLTEPLQDIPTPKHIPEHIFKNAINFRFVE